MFAPARTHGENLGTSETELFADGRDLSVFRRRDAAVRGGDDIEALDEPGPLFGRRQFAVLARHDVVLRAAEQTSLALGDLDREGGLVGLELCHFRHDSFHLAGLRLIDVEVGMGNPGEHIGERCEMAGLVVGESFESGGNAAYGLGVAVVAALLGFDPEPAEDSHRWILLAGHGIAPRSPEAALRATLGAMALSSGDEIVLLCNPRCSKSRAAHALLVERGVEFRERRYLEEPLSLDELEDLAGRLALEPAQWIRKGESAFADAGLTGETKADALLAAVVEHPVLLERPILVRGARAIVGRPPERVLELL